MSDPFLFTVTGRGSFPIDMLRYDRCHPRHETDSRLIEDSFLPRTQRVFDDLPDEKVELGGVRRPTPERWASFGWKVVV